MITPKIIFLFNVEYEMVHLRPIHTNKDKYISVHIITRYHSVFYKQSPFKASHVTRRPSLKRLSGMQVQLLSVWTGKHQILQNCSPSLRLNFIFEITIFILLQ